MKRALSAVSAPCFRPDMEDASVPNAPSELPVVTIRKMTSTWLVTVWEHGDVDETYFETEEQARFFAERECLRVGIGIPAIVTDAQVIEALDTR
jgi:hypothetical protein